MSGKNKLNVKELEEKLREILPPDLRPESALFSAAIVSLTENKTPRIPKNKQTKLAQILSFLEGSNINTPNSIITFRHDSDIGSVAIRDVAGQDIVKINLNIFLRETQKQTENIANNKKILEIHKQRLQILEEQAAIFGTLCPPHILIEIGILKEKIADLQ